MLKKVFTRPARIPVLIVSVMVFIGVVIFSHDYDVKNQYQACLADALVMQQNCRNTCNDTHQTNQQECSTSMVISGLKFEESKTCQSFIEESFQKCSWRCQAPQSSGQAGCLEYLEKNSFSRRVLNGMSI